MIKRIAIAGVILLLALALAGMPDSPYPSPTPAGELDLSACFQGADAGKDAQTVAALASEIANAIEWDGSREEPVLTTGFALDQLRTRSRELMCEGVSLGQKHPLLCERVAEYLTEKLGTSGGEVTSEQRGKWVAAYREIARAAREQVK